MFVVVLEHSRCWCCRPLFVLVMLLLLLVLLVLLGLSGAICPDCVGLWCKRDADIFLAGGLARTCLAAGLVCIGSVGGGENARGGDGSWAADDRDVPTAHPSSPCRHDSHGH